MIKFYLFFHFGGIGVISVLSNLIPNDVHNMVFNFLNGNIKDSIDLQIKTLDLTDALFYEVNPIPVKEALNLLGFKVGDPRLPLVKISNIGKEKLKNAMQNYGLINKGGL